MAIIEKKLISYFWYYSMSQERQFIPRLTMCEKNIRIAAKLIHLKDFDLLQGPLRINAGSATSVSKYRNFSCGRIGRFIIMTIRRLQAPLCPNNCNCSESSYDQCRLHVPRFLISKFV